MSENKVSSILKNISGEIKIKILKFLSQKGEAQSFTNIMNFLKMDPSTDAGKFGYHLKMLKDNKVIEGGAEKGYTLTGLGEKVVDVIWDLSDTAIKKEIKVRTSDYNIVKFDRSRIAKALIKEANMSEEKAEEIARETEEKLLNSNINYLTAPLIREAVNFILLEKGLENYRHQLTRLGLPPYDVKNLISKPVDFYEPDYIKKISGDSILEQFLFLNVLEFRISDAHLSGEIFIPNANNFILMPNSVQHDARIFLKDGLNDIFLNSLSPPKSLNAALQILSKILIEMSNANEQGFDCINILLAPYIKNLKDKDIKRALRIFIENLSTSSLNLGKNLGLNFEIPLFLSKENAIGSDIESNHKYEDYFEESLKFIEILLDVLKEGDNNSRPFLIPNCFFKLKDAYLDNSEMENCIQKLNELIVLNGTPFLINLNKTKVGSNVNQTSSLESLKFDWKDPEIDTLRTGNLDWIIINLPRIAIEADNDDDKFFELLKARINLASDALMQKRSQIENRFKTKNLLPLLSLGIKGEYYYRIDNSTNTLAFLGLKEAISFHKKSNLVDNIDFALDIIKTFKNIAESIKKEKKIRYQVKHVPYNPRWSLNLFNLDSKKIEILNPKKQDRWIFTNYNGLLLENPLKLEKQIELESKIYENVDCYLSTIPLKDKNEVEEIRNLNKTMLKSDLRFFGYRFSYTYCASCNSRMDGTPRKCVSCGASENRLIYYKRNNGPYFF
ncbi:MAG: hypothetical protein EAX96_14070 [Candidatus Lokiarchaeota archaeon]|nr:hypothetical protein [Candidatus Lokiarchaeota archaeon]